MATDQGSLHLGRTTQSNSSTRNPFRYKSSRKKTLKKKRN